MKNIDENGAAMAELSERLFNSEEGLEGIRAFKEKRKPSWVQS